MSQFDRPRADRDPINPYAAPEAEAGLPPAADLGEDQTRAEAIRKLYLSHETSVKSLGSLHYFGAVMLGLGAVGTGAFSMLARQGDNTFTPLLLGVAAIYALLCCLNIALGRGLRRLRPWARWTDSAFTGLGFFSSLVGLLRAFLSGLYAPILGGGLVLLFEAYILNLLLSSKASVVFSREYREIVEKTPHVRYRPSLLVRIAVAIFVLFVTMAIVGALLGG